MKNALLFSVILLGISSSCTKRDINKDTPKCVKEEIVQFNKDQSCEDLKVDQYLFQEKNVYVFVVGNTCGADMTSNVIDESCNSIGFLGGFKGDVMVNGENFYTNAQFIKTVWEK